MEDTIVRKLVYVHAGSDEELNRRVETFTSALRACNGMILGVEYRGKFRGRRIAAISYEFPLRIEHAQWDSDDGADVERDRSLR